jgi:hypothetical protein
MSERITSGELVAGPRVQMSLVLRRDMGWSGRRSFLATPDAVATVKSLPLGPFGPRPCLTLHKVTEGGGADQEEDDSDEESGENSHGLKK